MSLHPKEMFPRLGTREQKIPMASGPPERFAIVEVPEDAVEYAIECLQGVRIRGRRVNVRRDRRDG